MTLFEYAFNATKIAFYDVMDAMALIVVAHSRTSYSYKTIDVLSRTKMVEDWRFYLFLDQPLLLLEFYLVNEKKLLARQVCSKFPILKLFEFNAAVSFHQVCVREVQLVHRYVYLSIASPFALLDSGMLWFEYTSQFCTQKQQLRLSNTSQKVRFSEADGYCAELVLEGTFFESGTLSVGIARAGAYFELFREQCSMNQHFVLQTAPQAYCRYMQRVAEQLDTENDQAFIALASIWYLQHPLYKFLSNKKSVLQATQPGPPEIASVLGFCVLERYFQPFDFCKTYSLKSDPAHGKFMRYYVAEVLKNGEPLPFIAAPSFSNTKSTYSCAFSQHVLTAHYVEVFCGGDLFTVEVPRVYAVEKDFVEVEAAAYTIRLFFVDSFERIHKQRFVFYRLRIDKPTNERYLVDYINYFNGLELAFFNKIAVSQQDDEIVFAKRCHKTEIGTYTGYLAFKSAYDAESSACRIVSDIYAKLKLLLSDTEAEIFRYALVRICGLTPRASSQTRNSASRVERLQREINSSALASSRQRLWRTPSQDCKPAKSPAEEEPNNKSSASATLQGALKSVFWPAGLYSY